MLRIAWLNPLCLAIAAGLAMGVCGALHVDPQPRAMLAAALINILAAELAAVPLAMSAGAGQATIVQAGLMGTVIQLFAAAALSGIVLWISRQGAPFVFWVLPLYWISLIVTVWQIVRAIKLAPVLPATGPKP